MTTERRPDVVNPGPPVWLAGLIVLTCSLVLGAAIAVPWLAVRAFT